jgi:LmbE family N-acetylglucosaminyl deacetylase
MKILLVTAHPDDEAIWGAASLSALAQRGLIDVRVICLWTACEPMGSISGTLDKKTDYLRESHFYSSVKVLGFSDSFIATESYPEKLSTETLGLALEQGLKELGKKLNDFDIIVSHSYYGDERRHPHHIKLFNLISELTKSTDIGHSFFSFIPIKTLGHRPVSNSIKRAGKFQLIGEFLCHPEGEIKENFSQFCQQGKIKMFICQGDLETKRKAIEEYKTIDLIKHDNDYGSFTSSTDFLYCDYKSSAIIDKFFSLDKNFQIPTYLTNEM